MPDFIEPELAMLVDHAPDGDSWIHEIKFNGYRTAGRIEGGKVRMLTRRGLDWTARFQPIARALAELPLREAYLDGEIAVLAADGVTSFAALEEALSRRQGSRLTYHVFDLLHLDGQDLTGFPLLERKRLLEICSWPARQGPGGSATPSMPWVTGRTAFAMPAR